MFTGHEPVPFSNNFVNDFFFGRSLNQGPFGEERFQVDVSFQLLYHTKGLSLTLASALRDACIGSNAR